MVERQYRAKNNKDKVPNQNNVQKKKNIYFSIPYIKGLHEKMVPLFKKYDMNIVGKANKPLETTLFSKLKDVVPVEKQSNLVYNIKCECNSDYIGQTTQYLGTRIKQHINDGKTRKIRTQKVLFLNIFKIQGI